MVLFMDREVSKLKTWELYVGFVFVQILVGIIVTLLISVFDLVGIRGALSQVVRQLGVVMNAQPMQKYVSPIAGELKEGKYI
jgi:hypothetical protein